MIYVGRFAPSPTGPLHAGSLVAALASYLDARCHRGTWLLRIEDVDETRAVPGAAEDIMRTLLALGMQWDGDVVWQSHRKPLYEAACERLNGLVYPCCCTRSEIADSQPRARKAAEGTGIVSSVAADGAMIYPGTCRHGLAPGRPARVLRLCVPEDDDTAGLISFTDRWQGPMSQDLATEVGDFVVRRADGFWAYQLAVVADDADQGVTDVVRGADLLDSTARQIYLQRALSLPTPRYLHVPAVTNDRGDKLSKQTGATAIDVQRPLEELKKAACFLGLEVSAAASQQQFWESAIAQWGRRFAIAG